MHVYCMFFRGVKEKRGHLAVRETSEAWYEWHFNLISFPDLFSWLRPQEIWERN